MNTNFYTSPDRIMSRHDLEKEPPPSSSGIYGWYFDKSLLNKFPSNVLQDDSSDYFRGRIFKKRWKRLYIGRGINLKRRILDYHFCGDADVSSLRLSLGCLMAKDLKICLWKRPRPKEGEYGYTFGDKGEEKLTEWMVKNAWVVWNESPNYVNIERQFIIEYCPLLNTEGNPHSFAPLKVLKSNLKACALPRGNKMPWKDVKAAYERFEKQCSKKQIDETIETHGGWPVK